MRINGPPQVVVVLLLLFSDSDAAGACLGVLVLLIEGV